MGTGCGALEDARGDGRVGSGISIVSPVLAFLASPVNGSITIDPPVTCPSSS